jgi:hypothetical protein
MEKGGVGSRPEAVTQGIVPGGEGIHGWGALSESIHDSGKPFVVKHEVILPLAPL